MSSFTNIESGVGSSVESVDITDGTIVNADVSASAAIDGTKINEATTSARGTTEAAIASEVNTGTDAVRFVSPDSLAGSNLGTKSLIWRVVASDTALSATDGVDTILIPSSLNGMNLVRATAFVDTAGTTNATTSARGTTEAAIASEVNTGTDAVRFVSPDSLAGSNLGTKSLIWRVVASDTALSATDGVDTILIPSSLNGMNLVRATAFVDTAGTTNATTVDIYNVTGTADMLTGAISIASGDTVATAGTIDTANDDVSTDDKIRCDVTTVSTTPPSGLTVVLEFRLP